MTDQIDASIGRRVFRRRRLMGLTQQQLGEAIGVRFQQIQKYECGANRISAARLWFISRTLEVPVAYFFEQFDSTLTSLTQDRKATAEALDLVRTFSNIGALPRKRLLSLALNLSLAPHQPSANA